MDGEERDNALKSEILSDKPDDSEHAQEDSASFEEIPKVQEIEEMNELDSKQMQEKINQTQREQATARSLDSKGTVTYKKRKQMSFVYASIVLCIFTSVVLV